MYNLEDTICAQSTPQGRGGLHVIRVSGINSLSSVRGIFSGFPNKVEPNYVYYGKIKDPKTQKIIDEVMVTFFAKGKSFTAEDTVEISCHGNPVIVREILSLLIESGCRIADRGEFTYRAYKNGRINLAQAESVLMLIEANSMSFLDKALRQLDGQFTKSLLTVEDKLIWVVSRLEAMLDFASEDIEIEKKDAILEKLDTGIDFLTPLVINFETRSLIDKGIKTLILGPPNVGKSSLLNEVLGRKRAIVSEIAGTTRDFVSETTIINDIAFEIIDTAGLRATENMIESEGIQMAKDLVDTADIVLILLDPENFELASQYIDLCKNKKYITLINKSELLTSDNLLEIKGFLSSLTDKFHFVSIHQKEGLDDVYQAMSSSFALKEQESSLEVISVRQKSLLEAVLRDLVEGREVFNQGISEEFVLSHLNSALKNLMQIRFIEDEEAVRDKIFKDFCLGK